MTDFTTNIGSVWSPLPDLCKETHNQQRDELFLQDVEIKL